MPIWLVIAVVYALFLGLTLAWNYAIHHSQRRSRKGRVLRFVPPKPRCPNRPLVH
jgi:hypothetical protein